ncbi:MAG: cysteine desulfurase [Marinilabiliaceae bacterium]|nr:cysteine desulfurase [Marinilabiliaceae bacterium]
MENIRPIYLDYAASTPVVEEVMNEIIPYFTSIYSNPSNTINTMGNAASQAVGKAQKQIKELLNAWDYEVIFTSGATEGINTCLKSLYSLYGQNKNHIITCKTEHKAVISVCEYLESIGAEISYLPVDKNGQISLEDLKNSIKNNTIAVALMAVNNEMGVIHDFKGISAICEANDVKFVCDATQAVGKIHVDPSTINIDYLILSGHKMYAPKGIGALLFKKGDKVNPLIHGGAQQGDLRSGTLNVPGIVGLGKAAEILKASREDLYVKIRELQETFEGELLKTGKIRVIGKEGNRSPYISNIQFLENDVEELIFPMRDKLYFSTGSACTSEIIEPSYVLKAMGLKNEEAERCLRFSYGMVTTKNEINQALTLLKSIIS